MFSSYRRVFLLALIMSAFYFVPFFVQGWSTDVWTRFMRIQEWVDAGFPFKETLMMSQNYPFGHEMHWTRPLDWIGYAFAWPFIPQWGLHRALEIMSFYVPLLTFLVGVGGFFYALKGYLTPKAAFLAFWLFFWGYGYAWGQSVVGYFDHHVFHFALLMWVLALCGRYFLKPRELSLMIWAGVLSAIGTWITAEFFINLYFVSVPFVFYWLFANRPLKPLLYYTVAYTVVLLGAMSFDHPISGFLTLDFYRVSLFHVLLGAFNCVGILLLMGFFKVISSTVLRRMIYGALVAVSLLTVLCIAFKDVFIQPLVDPFIKHFWIVYVQEMQPLYNSPAVINEVILPVLVAVGFLVYALMRLKKKETPFILLLVPGVLFYALLTAVHVRTGLSLCVFVLLLQTLFFNLVFFPREKKFWLTVLFLAVYLLGAGVALRGDAILARIKLETFNYYYHRYENDQNYVLPEEMKKDVVKEFERKQNVAKEIEQALVGKKVKSNAVKTNQLLSDRDPLSCSISEEVLEALKKTKDGGAVMMELFQSPEVLWKAGRPIFGGPYHGIISAHKDLFKSFLNRGDFSAVHDIVKKRHVSQIYVQHPRCYGYMFTHPDTGELYPNLDETFYYAVFNQSKKMPDWLELEFYNPKTDEKIFRVVEPQKKSKAKKKALK